MTEAQQARAGDGFATSERRRLQFSVLEHQPLTVQLAAVQADGYGVRLLRIWLPVALVIHEALSKTLLLAADWVKDQRQTQQNRSTTP